MNIMELGALGEFVGAVGVVASLIYVGLQVRHNTSALKATTRKALGDNTMTILSSPLDKTRLGDALMRSRSSKAEDLSPQDDLHLRLWANLNYRFWEDAHYQYRQGALDAHEWETRFVNTMRSTLRGQPIFVSFWDEVLPNRNYSPEFIDVVESIRTELAGEVSR